MDAEARRKAMVAVSKAVDPATASDAELEQQLALLAELDLWDGRQERELAELAFYVTPVEPASEPTPEAESDP